MEFLKKYEQYLFEFKNLGNLYHIVDIEKMNYILDNNTISSYKFYNISTTRDKMMNSYLGDASNSIFKLELDGSKLSHKYKIKPFAYKSNNNTYFDEGEEQIKTQNISNAFSYINKVILIKNRVERLKKSGWFSTDGGHYKEIGRVTLPILLKDILNKLKELDIDIYVQDKNIIKKDDDYINSILNYPITKINHGYSLYLRGMKEVFNTTINHLVYEDYVIPIDKRNHNIKKLVIGYDYQDLWLNKNIPDIPKNYNIKNYITKDSKYKDLELYIFDFTYENIDIIEETEQFIHLDTAQLKNVKNI